MAFFGAFQSAMRGNAKSVTQTKKVTQAGFDLGQHETPNAGLLRWFGLVEGGLLAPLRPAKTMLIRSDYWFLFEKNPIRWDFMTPFPTLLEKGDFIL